VKTYRRGASTPSEVAHLWLRTARETVRGADQTAFIVFEDEVKYADSGKITKITNKDMLDCLNSLIEDAGNVDAELATIRRRVDKDYKRSQKTLPAAVLGEYPPAEPAKAAGEGGQPTKA
jgi:hypothetical protein